MGDWRYSSPFLPSALDGGEWSAWRPGRFTPGTCSIGDRVGFIAGLDAVQKRKLLPLQEIESLLLGHPARSLVAISAELFRGGAT
jgi:hypothetical protein